MSVITLEEISYGLAWRPKPRVKAWLDAFVHSHSAVLLVDETIAAYAGSLRGAFQKAGDTRTQADMLIAATAKHHRLQLATRNGKDFEGCGVEVFSPFE